MTAKEAYEIIIENVPKADPISCREYDNIYVFASEGKTGLISVDKKDGSIKAFQPFHMSAKDYFAGKEVVDFK